MSRIKKEEIYFEERFTKICKNLDIDNNTRKKILIENKNITTQEISVLQKQKKKLPKPYSIFISDIYKILNNDYDNVSDCFPKEHIETVLERIPINSKIDKKRSNEISKIWNEINNETYIKKYKDEKNLYNLNLEIEKLNF